MTRISTAPTTVPKPDSVLFGELAIAAGLVGQPVAVCYSESTAAMDCELWKHFSEFAGSSHVLHVHSQKDVTTLRKAEQNLKSLGFDVEKMHIVLQEQQSLEERWER